MLTKIMLRTALVTLPLLAVGPLKADEPGSYAGKFSGTIVKQEARPLDDKGHVVVAQAAHGTNINTGEKDYMNGAQVLFSETLELANGNGPQHGLITFIKDGVSTTSSYTGTVKTTMVDGNPVTTASGHWTMVSAFGMKGEGSGTYSTTMTSPTTFESEWKGDKVLIVAKTATN